MHHLHISGFVIFLAVVFLLGFIAIILGWTASMRRDRLAAEVEKARIARGYSSASGSTGYASAGIGQQSRPAAFAAAPVAPVMMTPGYSGGDVALGVAAGALAGAAIGGAFSHHDTVIVESGPMFVDSAPIGYDDGGIDIDFD